MKLYVCYGTFTTTPRPGGHPCGNAHRALLEAGYQPEVIRSYGFGPLPSMLNDLTSGRREVKELTGHYWVPVLVLDDGTVIQDSTTIVEWAKAHPAAGYRRPRPPREPEVGEPPETAIAGVSRVHRSARASACTRSAAREGPSCSAAQAANS